MAAAADLVPDLDALVHCVVQPLGGRLLDLEPADVAAVIEVNGTSLLDLVQAAQPLLRSGSSVIYLSSRGSQIALPGYGPAGAPKALGECLVRYLAAELAADGVRVNTIVAGALDTNASGQSSATRPATSHGLARGASTATRSASTTSSARPDS